MNFLIFAINIILLVFFIKQLGLVGSKYVSMPGIYMMLSALPTLTLVIPSFNNLVELRPGYDEYLISILLHTGFMGFGILLSYIMISGTKIPNRSYSLLHYLQSTKLDKVMVCILVFTILVFIHQILTLGSVPFFLVFAGVDVASLTMARETGYKLHGGLGVYVWHFSRMVFIPFLVSYYFVKYLEKRTSSTLFITILLFGIVNNALSGAKAPVAMIFLIMAVTYFNLKGKVEVMRLLYAAIGILVFPFVIEFIYSDLNFFDALEHFLIKFVDRFSYETFDRTLSYFDIFPHQQEYLGGRTNSLFLLFTGNEYFNVQNFVFLERLDSLKDHLLYGSANAHFIGYMNADFGILGVMISSFIIGFIMGGMDSISSSVLNNKLLYPLYVIMGFIFWKLMGSQPTSVLFSHGAILSFIILFILSKHCKYNIQRANYERYKTI
jgi:oligosaccharide repeat unit polymerase